MGGGDQKRVKASFDCPEALGANLKGQVEDLKFIVNHLRTDVTCTLESSVKQLKMTVEREIGLLVYSLTEATLREQVKLKDHLAALQKENSLLIENEGNIMDELARITLENEKLTKFNFGSLDETVLKELAELEVILNDNDEMLNMIKCLKHELEHEKTLMLQEKERIIECERIICEKDNEISNLQSSINEAVTKIDLISRELEDKKTEICEVYTKIAGLEQDYEEQRVKDEGKIKELVTMNSELMDLSEQGKQKELELTRKNLELEKQKKDSEAEKATLKEEIESLKKAMTAQKIELERGRETLNRERKLAALKISDLQEQVEELKNKKSELDENSYELRNKH